MSEHLIQWLEADKKISEIKSQIASLQETLGWAEKEAESAMLFIKDEMVSTGEYEMNISGEYCDYKISFTTPRESVKVDAEAVPDEFCKIERRPKLKEIGDYLREAEAKPNWARFEKSEPKLTYKICKKKA